MRRIYLAVVLALLWIPISGQNIQLTLDSLIKAQHIPGLGVAVISSSQTQLYFSGTISSESDRLVNAASKWHLGSCTKAFTSFLAAQLVEDGLISFESKLVDVVPKLKKDMRKEFKKVTLEDLLSHRAGIPPFTQGTEFLFLPKFKGTASEKRFQFAKRIVSKPPYPLNGESYVYSNAGYAMAALMLEQCSGKSWEELIAELCTSQSWSPYIGFPNRNDENDVWGHSASPEKKLIPLRPDDTYRLKDFIAPAGDLSLPLPDYAQFIQLHLQGLQGKDNIVAASQYERLHFGRSPYALGWIHQVAPEDGERNSGHDGTVGVFYCHTLLFPDLDQALVIVMNVAHPHAVAAFPFLEELFLKRP